MIQLLQKLRLWLIPPISRRKALKIAAEACAPDADLTFIQVRQLHRGYIYNMPTEPCWCIDVPWGDGKDGLALRSSRVILISKQTGAILYDGSLNDEG